MLTEIDLCHACSCEEIEDGNAPGREGQHQLAREELSAAVAAASKRATDGAGAAAGAAAAVAAVVGSPSSTAPAAHSVLSTGNEQQRELQSALAQERESLATAKGALSEVEAALVAERQTLGEAEAALAAEKQTLGEAQAALAAEKQTLGEAEGAVTSAEEDAAAPPRARPVLLAQLHRPPLRALSAPCALTVCLVPRRWRKRASDARRHARRRLYQVATTAPCGRCRPPSRMMLTTARGKLLRQIGTSGACCAMAAAALSRSPRATLPGPACLPNVVLTAEPVRRWLRS
jgi:hypothetical protein